MTDLPAPAPRVTGLILAGGLGRRMGGMDKGLQLLGGKPLVEWVLERLSPQVDEVIVNANRNIARYAQLGCRVVPDIVSGHAGPLAGLQRGLMEAAGELVATVPCDAPCFPADLVKRLAEPLRGKNVDLAVARSGGRMQPVFCLARKSLLPQLTAFMEDGGRKVDAWFSTLRTATVEFGSEAAFANVNTPDDLSNLERMPPRQGKQRAKMP